jgi:hypothetical protein
MPRCSDIHGLDDELHENTSHGVCEIKPADGQTDRDRQTDRRTPLIRFPAREFSNMYLSKVDCYLI